MPDLNLGVIGNSSVAALIDRRGRIVWYCLPRFDGDPVFCSLLNGEDPAEGFAEILLENLASASQEYLGNTSVLVTTLTDAHGATLRITDFAPRFKQYDRRFRPAMLIRRVDVVSGLPAIRIRIRPAGGLRSESPERASTSWMGRNPPPCSPRWTSPPRWPSATPDGSTPWMRPRGASWSSAPT